MNNIKMSYCNRIGVSEETDVDSTSKSKECDTCFNKMSAMDAMIY